MLKKLWQFITFNNGDFFLFIGIFLALIMSAMLFFSRTVEVYIQRELTYLVMQDRLDVFESSQRSVGASMELLNLAKQAPEPRHDQPYITISIEDHHLWYKQKGKLLFSAPVATGSGKTLVHAGGDSVWKFETPRGRLIVQSKEEAPMWIPPDWHYVEQSRSRGIGLMRLDFGQTRTLSDGSVLRVNGYDVVRVFPNGTTQVLSASEKQEIILDGKLVIPPIGTAQRRYKDVLGPFSLELGNGYAIHGTDEPTSIGHGVSHGCVRMYNDDITKLWKMVPVGTPVYIY